LRRFLAKKELNYLCTFFPPNLSFNLLKTSRFLGFHLECKTITTWELW
jgi:hypothetical protein